MFICLFCLGIRWFKNISFLFFSLSFIPLHQCHSPSPMLCLALVKRCYLKDIPVHCVVPENIHFSLMEGYWKF